MALNDELCPPIRRGAGASTFDYVKTNAGNLVLTKGFNRA